MNEFKYLCPINFEHHLKLYERVSTSLIQEINCFESKPLTTEDSYELTVYKHSLKTLIENTFLQIYSALEESFYFECESHVIKKNASIIRFESALRAYGFNISNEYWTTLIHLSKIRNCLLHGNGRLDHDQYGEDTRNTINSLNSAASMSLIEVIDLKNTSKMKLNASFLYYCNTAIKHFINAQNSTVKN